MKIEIDCSGDHFRVRLISDRGTTRGAWTVSSPEKVLRRVQTLLRKIGNGLHEEPPHPRPKR